jgi:voltage-gated potassium channel
MSTVGYGDLFPVSAAGRIIAGMFILFTLGTVGLLITAVSEAVMEVRRMEEHGLIGTRMEGHVIVCGFNAMARAALIELLAAGRKVALLCESPAELEGARELRRGDQLFVTSGDPSQEVLRDRLNAGGAVAAVVAMRDDAKNLIAALNLKVVSPQIRLVVALQREELRQTLLAGGVTYVASPNELSGRLVASAAFEPEVAQMLEDLMSGAVGETDMQQFPAGPFGGRTVGEVRTELNALDGPLLVALARKNGDGYKLMPNPSRDTRIEAADQMIVITDEKQSARLAARLPKHQGR